ncbi:Fasciclin domain-containing protein [Sphingobacterium nematocida]|uniref:Fasciclin domain-containing protein n=1 Tax=Sphingobacterium nematocida TaxID=1513896 RepID=A0A1T5GEB0_9SPHI|nr:fasciclin domain-containing protein [Sphingobacterium nematocida]SKC06758.1 Fasciclin domain-containing protein [Sphingobacterium nematocida]
MQANYLRYLTVILFFSMCFMQSCNKHFNEYYHPKSTLGNSIIGILEEKGEYGVFLSLIDKADLRKSLSESAIYTCLAPKDDFVKEYFLDKLKYNSLDQVPLAEVRAYINYHFINGMYYTYDLEKRYASTQSAISKSRITNYKTRSEGKNVGKNLRILTPSFFAGQASDFEYMYGEGDGAAYYVEGVKISATEYDIDARNGVVHVLDAPLFPTLRTDLALANDPDLSIFSRWVERHAQYVLGDVDENGNVDTTLYKNFSFGRNLADENTLSTLFAPTNEAIAAYFEPYMDILDNTLDSVPPHVMYSIIRSSVHANLWYHSDLVRNDPQWNALTGFIRFGNPVLESIEGMTPASNSFIYKTNRLMESPEMSSVRSGIMMKYKEYSQWFWMMTNKGLGSGLVDVLFYQHSPKTLLVQSDESWGSPFAQDMDAVALEARLKECKTGIFHFDAHADGGFKKRFYPTDEGYILYDNNKFYDYTGHAVNLLTSSPVWAKPTGAIYEIDGFLKPLDRLDTENTVWKEIQSNTNLSSFKSLVDKALMAGELQLTGFFTYSVFAPSNAAISAAGINVATISADAAKAIVNRHIVTNRHLFTDGVFNGQLANKKGEYLTFSGAWDTFRIQYQANVAATLPTASNMQGSNGVVHIVNKVL